MTPKLRPVVVASLIILGMMAAPAAFGANNDTELEQLRARVTQIQERMDFIRSNLKQALTSAGLDEAQREAAHRRIEGFAQSYAKMAASDDRALHEDNLQMYINGKMVPYFEELGLGWNPSQVISGVRDLTREEVALAIILAANPELWNDQNGAAKAQQEESKK